MLVPILPTFIEDELGGGRARRRPQRRRVRPHGDRRPPVDRPAHRPLRTPHGDAGRRAAGRRRRVRHACSPTRSAALLLLRGVAGIGEAALFVAAATLVADLAPPERRAEAASYFSVAVFGGLGIGPIIGELVVGDDRYHAAFGVAAALRRARRRARPRRAVAVELADGDDGSRSTSTPSAAAGRSSTPPRSARASCWPSGIGAFAVFSAFLPEYSRERRAARLRGAVRGLQRRLPAAAPDRGPAARTPRPPPLGHDRARARRRRR